MNIREFTEKLESEQLSKWAVKSKDSKGRKRFEEPCEIRTAFQRDRDRITHSKAFRRLMHKTQVFIAPEGDHYRTRLTHTLEVSQISRTIARALRLNEDLTEAIALGHDLGHTPFGHTGEDALNFIATNGFRHNEQSVRIVDCLEKNGEGLNLSEEVLDGILNHRGGGKPSTLEGSIVQIADKVAYINHDIDDALRAGVLKQEDLPKDLIDFLGQTSSQRINFLVNNLIKNSLGKSEIELEAEARTAMSKLRKFLFATVYESQLQQVERDKISFMLAQLHAHYMKNINKLPSEFLMLIKQGESETNAVCDYIACMTDRFALKKFEQIFMPSSWNV